MNTEVKTLSLHHLLNFTQTMLDTDLIKEFENTVRDYFERIAEEMIEDFGREPSYDDETGEKETSMNRESGIFEFEIIELQYGDFEFNVYTRSDYNIVFTRTYTTPDNLPF